MPGSITLQHDAPIARVVLGNPGKLNAIDIAMWRELRTLFEGLQALPAADAPRAVIVCGSGGQFASGGDIVEFADFRFDETRLHDFHENIVAPALQDLIAGQVDMMFDGLGSSANHIKGGRIKALAVASERRAPGFADVPTSAEAGLPTYQVATWYGLWAPKGTPHEAVDHMQAEMKKAFATSELQASWNGLGTDVPNLYGDAYGKFVSSEIKRWAEVVKSSGAKLDG